MDHIHIFKTNITREQIPLLQSLFSAVRQVIQWTIDTEDCDRVLRVVSYELSDEQLMTLIAKNGFVCEELP